MKKTNQFMYSVLLCTALQLPIAVNTFAATPSDEYKGPPNGEIEFRVGSPKTTVIAGARVIVINPDGKILTTGLTDSTGTFRANVPFYITEWNENLKTKGIVTAIAVATGFNGQVVFIVPITNHTVQPIILQPITPNARNFPSASLGNIHQQDLRGFVAHYAEELKLKQQPAIPGDPGYLPWSPEQKKSGAAKP
ncbi:carboxypeptidase-like regulatory domain-containing protein [Ferroacidibacillus organovorans]|uniref:Bacterial Ig domain-containing protein n=1 Tax=Ferroacidibacillus organovorans TaxID=1765683 RepID=A0A162RWD2_9BACL|nr:carboxypeptidase-like regulatory domain-containing protein [Ferroacidibacillus organovorans]KYP79313.1 hypothetical protein AYJ22_04650 [Ferroacidibacillus organovorans]OAG95241.1 hypothetical protein AYW79_00780 [Ferroacidibacillus organovorans]OPG17214.1 hypothetical protein B2M26_02455 [Ferroacidibacillus organovorans]